MIPSHVAIILDGNRRYAKAQGLPSFKGHYAGAQRMQKVLQWAKDAGITELTFYAFSMQNFKRSPEEKQYLFKLFEEFFKKAFNAKELVNEQVRIRFLGRKNLFPDNMRKHMEELEEKTKDFQKYRLNFCMAYGGREEILDGVYQVAKAIEEGKLTSAQIKDWNDEDFAAYLYLNSYPDLIVRTSGEYRLSNFLTWQSTYSELIFERTPWPAVTKEIFTGWLKEFSSRERRFGGN